MSVLAGGASEPVSVTVAGNGNGCSGGGGGNRSVDGGLHGDGCTAKMVATNAATVKP